MRYIVITSIKNEEKYFENTIISMINQTMLPQEWVIVNDGSTDRTREIVFHYLEKYTWIKLVDREYSDEYKLGGHVVDNFYFGLKHIDSDYDFLVKLDGDLFFDNDYFEFIFKKFAKSHKLGMASGQSYVPVKNGLFWEDTPEDHVKGLLSTYRRECFQDIGGLVRSLGWDTIDEVTARMKGWETRSFKEKKIIHYRRLGSKMGILKGNVRHGYIAYIVGAHFFYVFLRCFYRIFENPFFIGSIAYFLGFFCAFITGQKKAVSRDVELFYKKEQLRKLFSEKFYITYYEKIKAFFKKDN